MQSDLPLTRDLVLIGGGHSHALVLRKWAMAPLPGTRVTLIDPSPFATYSGMLPGYVAGHYRREDLNIDLVRLARAAGARFVPAPAEGIDLADGSVTVRGRPGLRFDVLSIDIGVTSEMPAIPGFSRHAVPVKPLGPFASEWAQFVDQVETGHLPAEVTVIGAGVAGAEIAMAMARRLRGVTTSVHIRMIEASTALRGLGDRSARMLRDRMAGAGIELIENAPVKEVGGGWLQLEDGRQFTHAFCCGAAGARAHPWIEEAGLDTENGYVTVDARLRSVTSASVFAAGDCAHFRPDPRPKAGVYAVRQAPILFHNLRAELTGGRTRTYKPQRDYLKLVSLGEKAALADRRPLAFAAPWVWQWKNRIDRRFMEKFHDLPAMKPVPLPPEVTQGVREELGDKPFCGGCGAKVGAGGLGSVLSDLGPPLRDDVLSRPGDDAATLIVGNARQVITTDHLRSVVEDPWLMGRIAAIHALGDIWAMGAEPQAALASVIIPRMRRRMQAATLREITLAAEAVFRECGAELVGGHSTMGAELTVGFTLTGLIQHDPVTTAGAKPGDAVILTRPIGAGVLLAAEMQRIAPGNVMLALYDRMTRPQTQGAAILGPVAHAMTDVTGFGLAGHLLNIARASDVSVALDTEAVPIDRGALDLSRSSVRSSLFGDNRDATLPSMPGFAEDAFTDLMFDPQTCGGLLAAVPPDQAPSLLARLHDAGDGEAAIIGRIEDGPPLIRPMSRT